MGEPYREAAVDKGELSRHRRPDGVALNEAKVVPFSLLLLWEVREAKSRGKVNRTAKGRGRRVSVSGVQLGECRGQAQNGRKSLEWLSTSGCRTVVLVGKEWIENERVDEVKFVDEDGG